MRDTENFIIDSMTWSFSRINGFYSNCRKEWKEHYIDCEESYNSFDGQFGSFCHEILENYFKGNLGAFDLAPYYEEHYKEYVDIPCPYVNGDTKYEKGLEYFENFSFDLNKYEILGVEKEINFKIKDEYPLVGFIDLLYRDKETGEITLMDHKSSTIKVLKSGKISKTDEAHFQAFKRQQYLYSAVVLKEYGRVDYLAWNMFKDGTKICIPWKQEEFEEAINWAYDTIKSIEKETEFPPNPSSYYCQSLCSRRLDYCPYKRLGMVYEGIYSRCNNPKSKEYFDYGGAGIQLCDDWNNDKQKFFEWALDNGYGDDLILKRLDEDGDYTPDNCIWTWRDE